MFGSLSNLWEHDNMSWPRDHFDEVTTSLCFEDQNMAHYKISNRGSQILIFYLLVFDRIHDAMPLNKMFRISSRKTGPQH